TYTINGQYDPSVAMNQDGGFLVAWQSYGQDGSAEGVYAQRYSATGAPQAGEFRVNTYTTNGQRDPAVAIDAAGDTVVAWMSNGQDGSSNGIYAQRYRYTPPRVSATQINDGTAQRSRVTSLTVTFSTQVTFAGTPGAAFTLTRNSDGA